MPKKIRQELGDEMVVAKWYENCLVLVSREDWQELIKRLTGERGLITSPVRDIDRFIFGSAFEIELDSQGRFVLPEDLISYAEITSEVVFVGLGDRVEVWPTKKWRKLEEGSEKKASKAIDEIARKSKDEKENV